MLSVPVLAILPSTEDDATDATAPSRWWWARYVQIASEIVIVGFVAAWIVCLSADGAFAADIARQPLSTLGGSIERAWNIVAR